MPEDKPIKAIAHFQLIDEANTEILDLGDRFTDMITTQAKIMAALQGHDVVLSKHVRDGFDVIMDRPNPHSPQRDAFIGIAGVIAGFGGAGLLSILTGANVSTGVAILFAGLVVAGLLVLFAAAYPKSIKWLSRNNR